MPRRSGPSAGSVTPWMDTQSKGVIAGLTLNTTRGELVRETNARLQPAWRVRVFVSLYKEFHPDGRSFPHRNASTMARTLCRIIFP